MQGRAHTFVRGGVVGGGGGGEEDRLVIMLFLVTCALFLQFWPGGAACRVDEDRGLGQLQRQEIGQLDLVGTGLS